MAGELVPLVMLPRYTTLAGASTFTTIAMDVTDYQTAILNIWRGRLITDTTFAVTCEESTDQETWSTCAGTNVSAYDPGQETEGQASATIKKRWFRVKVVLATTGDPPHASCWAVGFLEQREQ
jgi:hypothetical protein